MTIGFSGKLVATTAVILGVGLAVVPITPADAQGRRPHKPWPIVRDHRSGAWQPKDKDTVVRDHRGGAWRPCNPNHHYCRPVGR